MMKTLLAATAACSLVACVAQDDSPKDIDRALPTAQQVAINIPGGSAREATSRDTSSVVGQIATYYGATRDVSRLFNGATGLVLGLVHAIVQYPVTSADDNVLTWGPWTEALDPAEYKLEVQIVGDGTYEYKLSGRSKLDANAAFEALLVGKADPRNGELNGSGAIKIDFDAIARVNPIDNADAKGHLQANYDLAKHHLDLVATAPDAQGNPASISYAYNDDTNGGGDLTFALALNAGGGPANETVTLRSRWLANGAGRADARVTGGDLIDATATASECWSTSFQRVFYVDAITAGGTLSASEGNESACAFATPDLPQ